MKASAVVNVHMIFKLCTIYTVHTRRGQHCVSAPQTREAHLGKYYYSKTGVKTREEALLTGRRLPGAGGVAACQQHGA